MNRKQRLTWAIALATALPLGAFAAPANGPLNDSVRRGESEQAQIKTQVQRATEDLSAIIAELDRNGIGGDDVKMLIRIRDVLGDLTQRDMATVITLLQQARGGANARGDLTQAVVSQDQIIVKLKQVLLEYKRQQDLYELSLRFTELANRQNANYKQLQAIFRTAGTNATAGQLNDGQKESQSLQVGDQDAIREETRMLIGKVRQIIAETDPETAARLTKSLEEAERGRLEKSLEDASTALKETKLGNAGSAENRARSGLYALANLVAPPEDSATKLRKAAAELDKAIAEEKIVIGQTAALSSEQGRGDPTSFKESYWLVVDRQSDNTELVDRLQKSIDVLAPDAAGVLNLGKKKMFDAWSAIRDFHREAASENEKAALAKLEEARKLLETQIAKADADRPTGDAIQQTKELKEKVATLRAEQEKLNAQTKAAQPRDGTKLAKDEAEQNQKARDLQIEAAPQSMKAADEIAAAAKEMDRSRETLEKGALAEANSPQKSAVDHLARAEQQLDAQLAKLEQDQKDLAKLADAREQVAKLISEQGHVANDTAREVGKQEASKPEDKKGNSDADKKLAQKQSDVGKKTDDARQSLPEAAKAAAQPLDSARQKMGDAKKDLDQEQPKGAQPPEQEAIAELNKAKDAIDQKMSDLQKELGQQQDNSSKLEQLSKELQQAQKDLSDTQQAMQQSPAQQLAQQQQQIAQQLQDQQKQNPGDASLQKAQKAADQAAQDLQDNKPEKAVSEMQQVQTAIQQSQQAQQQQSQSSQPGKEGQKKPDSGKPSDPSKSQQAGAQKPGDKKDGGKPGEQGQSGKGDKPGEGQQPGQASAQAPSDKAGQGQGQQGQQGGQGGAPGQSMAGISQQQAAVQKAAEQLASAQGQQQMQQAAEQLGQVASKVTDAAANDQGALPNGAQQALQQAQKALNEATGQAQAGNKPSAQAQAQSAQAAISQAQAALDMAKQGMQPGQMADASAPQSQQQQAGSPEAPSQGAPGAPAPSPGKKDTPGQNGTGDRKDIHGGETQNGGPRGAVAGNSTYLSLPARDRAAIQQGQKDKYPEEYGPAIEQYLKNLSDQEK